jgi:DNA integrity scanning protein DisA with diadenylate cyclase activity
MTNQEDINTPVMDVLADVCSENREVNVKTLEKVVMLAVEIAREGREGRKVGTLFTVGDEEAVLTQTRALILDPLYAHANDRKRLDDANLWETVKELAQLDGAFVVSEDGVVIAAARYLNASSSGIDLPLGLGSRHMAGASISLRTNAVVVVVSESSMVRVFDEGEIVAEIVPELWMLRRYGVQIEGEYATHAGEHMTVISKIEDE